MEDRLRFRFRTIYRWMGVAAAVAGLAASTGIQKAAAKPAAQPSLPRRVASLIATYEGSGKAIVGVSVRDAAGREIVAVRDDRLFVPASNQKILTSAFALAALGGEFKFDTRVYARGSEIVIVGDFDPTVGDPAIAEATGRGIYADLDAWAAAAARHFGQRPISAVVVASRADPNPRRHPDWPANQYRTTYAAPVCSLNFANNRIRTTFNVEAGRARMELSPASRFIGVVNKLKRGGNAPWPLEPNEDMSAVTQRGTIKASATTITETAIDKPDLLLGRVFADRLVRAGGNFGGSIRAQDASTFDASKASLIASTRRPLQAALWRMNKHSLNMAAEAVLLRGGDGTWAGSAKMMSVSLVNNYGLAAGSLVVSDGSGLSANNRVSPSAMTATLVGVLERDDWRVFVNALPVAGVESRMRKRLSDRPYRGRVLAKTGHIQGAQCLSGYILNQNNEVAMAYSVLVNRVPTGHGSTAQAVHDDICRLLVDVVDGRKRR